jgi:hypothetical protein
MKITKQRLRKIIKEELSNVLSEMNEKDYHAVRLRLQVEYGVDDASGNLIEDVYRIWPRFATEAVEVKPEIDQAIKKAIEDDAAAESVPAMSLEEAAPWDKEELKGRYPRDYKKHAIIDQAHADGMRFDDVMKKLDHRPGASTRPNQGRWGY